MLADISGALAILTRPQGHNDSLASQLRQAGIDVSVQPVLRLIPAATPAPVPGGFDLVMFVSAAAARFYFEQIHGGRGASWPDTTLACTVGPASARALRDAGVIPAENIVHPGPESPNHDSEALWALLAPRLPAIKRALIVRGETGREWLGRQLEGAGIEVRHHAAYRREPILWAAGQADELARRLSAASSSVCLVTSTESADALHANIEHHAVRLRQLWERVRFVTIHPRVASRLTSRFTVASGVPPSVRLCAADDGAVFQAIQSLALS
ncbi:MAG TPA: uroporphyrinogen-III synthase [Burkholderiaceae bacterium]|nr:uroporphyrinogen-III synthase [Burkholderiaceae bacterium]